jgi:arginase
MAEAARLPLEYPETAVVCESTLAEQSLAVATVLPSRPLVLGGCCCAHIGAVEGLATRHGRTAVVWIDAHGDLNTPESSPSGNEWGMALRMLIDGGAVAPADVALVGSRNLDPPEDAYVAEAGLILGSEGVERALDGAAAVYVAIDADGLDPGEGVTAFMPEPAGLTLSDAEALLLRIAAAKPIAGAGFTGLVAEPLNVGPLTRLCAALGF